MDLSEPPSVDELFCQNCGLRGGKAMTLGTFCSDECQEEYGQKLYRGHGLKYCKKCGLELGLAAQACDRCNEEQQTYRS
ncbi:MAG: hypothetical protein ABSB75_07045 [Candidatus Limnocylindrales bacterium]|jgi:hypothetical protein